jgi:hypothetical protein
MNKKEHSLEQKDQISVKYGSFENDLDYREVVEKPKGIFEF